RHEQHVRALMPGVDVEPLGRLLPEHDRRERPKALAELDLHVERGLHAWRARIAENGPCPQRARSKLHPPLEPTDHLLLGQELGDMLHQAALIFEALMRSLDASQKPLDFFARKPWAQEATFLCVAGTTRIAEQLVPNEQCCAERATGVSRG